MPTSEIINYRVYSNSTRQTIGSSASYTAFSFTYNKIEAGTDLIIQTTIPTRGGGGGTFAFVDVDGTKKYTGITRTLYSGETLINVLQRWSGLTTGIKTISFGWSTNDGSSAQLWGVLHPNSSDDGRNRQTGSNWLVYEIKGVQSISISSRG